MRRLIIYTFIAMLNNLWSLGVDALLIPQKANILALSELVLEEMLILGLIRFL